MGVEDLDRYIEAASHVWTHSVFWEPHSLEVLSKFEHVVYIVRDPRDVALSAARFAFTPYMPTFYPHVYPDEETYLVSQLETILRNWVDHVSGYLRHLDTLNIHFLRYEDLLLNTEETVGTLANSLDMTLSAEQLRRVRQETAFDTMKSHSPNHVYKGRSGKWRGRLTAAQQKQALLITQPLLRELGYEVDTAVGVQ